MLTLAARTLLDRMIADHKVLTRSNYAFDPHFYLVDRKTGERQLQNRRAGLDLISTDAVRVLHEYGTHTDWEPTDHR